MAARLEQIANLGHEEKDAARLYAEQGSLTARGMREEAISKLEDAARGRERMAFLQGIHWERERATRADFAELLRVGPQFAQVRVPPGHRARHIGGRLLPNPGPHVVIIPCLPGHAEDWAVEKL